MLHEYGYSFALKHGLIALNWLQPDSILLIGGLESAEQAVQLQAMLKEKSVEEVIKEVTQLQDQTIIDRIVKAYVD